MKSFIVFAAVVAVVCANNIGKVGWGSPGSAPSIDLELAAAAAAAGSGQASAGQALLELVSGTIDAPSILANINGLDTSVSQGEDLSQVQLASKPDGATSTINAADVYNEAEADDNLDASLSGGLAAVVQNTASSDASGQGAIAAEESSLNNVQS